MSKSEMMSTIQKIGTYQPSVANDLLKLVNNEDSDGRIHSALQKQFRFRDSDSLSTIIRDVASGLESTYKSRGDIFNDVFKNPTPVSSSSFSDDSSSFRLSSLRSGSGSGSGSGFGSRYTLSNRPLSGESPLAGPYFCPDTPDRVKVDGMIVVQKQDDVRDFYGGGVMVMRVRVGKPEDFKSPGTERCKIVDVYRKAIRQYEEEYKRKASSGHNLIPWVFYLDNGGMSEEETRADSEWISDETEYKDSIVLSRFDGRNDMGYVKNRIFKLDDFKTDAVVDFFRRKGLDNQVYAETQIGDSDCIRFVESDDSDDKDGLTAAACGRVMKFLKSDQTVVIVISKLFLQERGFDEKIMNLTNIVRRLRKSNMSFYDRIAYYLHNGDKAFMYPVTDKEYESAENSPAIVKSGGKLDAKDDINVANITITGIGEDTIITPTKIEVLPADVLNFMYNGTNKYACYQDSTTNKLFSSTALFQIIRGSNSTKILEMYIPKDAPEINNPLTYAEDNPFTQQLSLQNIVNIAKIPYVNEQLLSDFAQRGERFPLLTSESRARRFFVRPIPVELNMFLNKSAAGAAGAAGECFLYKYDQLQPRVIDDLKSGKCVILYPECDGTEGSCVPPQLQYLADRYDAILHEAPKSHFDLKHGAIVVLLRAERRLTHNNYDLFMISGTNKTTFDIGGNCTEVTNFDNTCKFTSEDLDIPKMIQFISKSKLSNRNFRGGCSTTKSASKPAVQVEGLANLWSV